MFDPETIKQIPRVHRSSFASAKHSDQTNTNHGKQYAFSPSKVPTPHNGIGNYVTSWVTSIRLKAFDSKIMTHIFESKPLTQCFWLKSVDSNQCTSSFNCFMSTSMWLTYWLITPHSTSTTTYTTIIRMHCILSSHAILIVPSTINVIQYTDDPCYRVSYFNVHFNHLVDLLCERILQRAYSSISIKKYCSR